MTLLDAALDLQASCLSVVPVRADGTKAPAAFWKQYQDQPAPEQLIREWFAPRGDGTTSYDGLGVITGTVSGNLEMLEIEGRAIDLVTPLAQLLTDSGFGDLWSRLCNGYLEQSPSGGWHWLYRVDGPGDETNPVCRPNTKLARRPSTADELAAWKTAEAEKAAAIGSAGAREARLAKIAATTAAQVPQVLIETRGEGGFVVTAPSAGRSHPTGRAWTMIAGGPTTIPLITVEERDALYVACSTFDTMPAAELPAAGGVTRGPLTSINGGAGGAEQDRPGDDYGTRTTWEEILEPHGWTKGRTIGGNVSWTRPGKHARDGISATTSDTGFYVFTSSTEFDTEVPYTKFGTYAVLEHRGDHQAAAKALRGAGFGKPYEPPTLTISGAPAAPTPVPANGTQAAAATNGATVQQLQPRPVNTLVMSEDGHAHQLIDAYRDLIRYCPQRGAWLAWSGSRWVWQPQGGGDVREYAKTVARAFPATSSAEHTHKKRSLSAAGITGCLKQAQTDERIVVQLGHLDAQPYLLNTPAGVVDLHTGQIVDPDPAALCTKQTEVAPAGLNGGDLDPIWQSFIDDTFGTDPAGREMQAYVQRLVGVTLIGRVHEQLFAFLHGLGANGKSTLVETLMHALGIGENGYAVAAPAEMLMVRKHEAHPAELAQLAGARMVVCSELDDGQRFAEARIKLLTGRDSINARFLYGQPFTFQPTWTMWVVGNHKPQARTGGMAFWRRTKLIEFPNVVPAERRDPALGDKLDAAAGTVLAWAIAGTVDYLAGGMREPASVARATEAYAADQDTVGRFVADACHRASSDLVRVNTAHLRTAYEAWCRSTGEEPVNPKRFGQELHDRFGVGDAKSNGNRFYTGICLLETEREEAGAEPSSAPPQHVTATLPGLGDGS